MSTCPTIRFSTCCPSDNADIYDYNAGDNTTPPPPVITCPVDFTGWTTDGEYEVPDFTASLEICAPCQEREDLTIVQEPPAGTVVTAQGSVTILITVTDPFGQIVTCSFVITVSDPPGTDSDDQTPTFPPWVYTPFLFAYWSANDTRCSPDIVDEGFPCFRRTDLSRYFGNASPRDLTNGGGAGYSTLETPLDGFPASAGPIFNRGSFASNNVATGYMYRADDTGLRLIGKSFTVAAFLKLVAIDAMETWQVAGKFSTLGYRIIVRRPDSSAVYVVTAELDNGTDLLTVPAQPFPLGEWLWVVMVFDAVLGQLRLYIDGDPFGADTSAGFVLTGEASQFRIGSGTSGGTDVFSCWSLDNTSWEDAIGGRHLTAVGAPIATTGKISNAMKDQGSSGYLSRADASLKMASGSWSIRAWANCDVFTGDDEWVIAGSFGTYGYKLFINQSGATTSMGYRVRNSAGNNATDSAVVSLDTWYHLVITYDATTRTVRWYLDAVLQDTTVLATAFDGSDTDTFQVGGGVVGAIAALTDEVQIYTKMLSGAEIITDYNSGNGTGCSSVASTADIYTDEIGIWLQAWSNARVAAQYALMEPYLT